MSTPLTIQGELHLPAAFLQGQPMDVIERRLHSYRLLPASVQRLRWRMDPEAPGGYVLAFTFALPLEESHAD